MSDETCTCGRPTSGAWLCDHCCKTLAVSLVNIAAYYDDLDNVASKRVRYGNTGATKGSIGKAQPLPVDTRFLDELGDGSRVRDDVHASIVAWARTVMEDQPEGVGPACLDCIHQSCTTIRRRRWPRDTVRSMVAYFDRQFRWLIREEWSPTFLDEMLWIERTLRRMVDRPADRWYAGKCSATDESGNVCTAELYALAERGEITCPGCGMIHDVAFRRDYLLEQAEDYHVTATEAALALLAWTDYDGTETKLVDRIRKWRDRDRLVVRDVTSLSGRDRHLYRLGDVKQLLIGDAQDAQSRTLDRSA